MYVAALYPLLLSVPYLEDSTHYLAQLVQRANGASQNSKPTTASTRPQGSHWWSQLWPTEQGNWTLLTTLVVASMSYSYSFYVANITAAFNCMSLSTRAVVPGEVQIKGMLWVQDMQLACRSPPHAAAMAVAAVIGIPMLVGYWMLLLTLAWPAQHAPGARQQNTSSSAWRAVQWFWINVKRACLQVLLLLEPAVRACQQCTSRVGVSGASCAALGVWNVEWRWWWLVSREILKLALVVVATVTSLRGPGAQARVMLLLVVVAAALSWRAQAGCGTSMNQVQFVMYSWLQLLALLVVVPSMVGIDATAFGGFLVALMALVMLQCAFVIGCLVVRCISICQEVAPLVSPGVAGMRPPSMISEEY